MNENEKSQRRISIIVIALLFALFAISITSLIMGIINGTRIDNNSDPTTIFAFIITSFAILVSTAVFLPKYQLSQLVEDRVKKEIAKQAHLNNENSIELLRTEAHHTRMIANSLIGGEPNMIWALGWSFKSLKTYMRLYELRPYNYSKFIQDYLLQNFIYIAHLLGASKAASKIKCKKSIKIKELVEELKDKEVVSRQFKDFVECLIFLKKLNQYDFGYTGIEYDYYKKGRIVIEEALNEGLKIIQWQLMNGDNKDLVKDIKDNMRFGDSKVLKSFEKFVSSPEKFETVNDFI